MYEGFAEWRLCQTAKLGYENIGLLVGYSLCIALFDS